MFKEQRVNRRNFLLGASAILATAATAGWLVLPVSNANLTIAATLQKLSGLDLSNIQFSGDWNAIVTLHHLAQSIEFSMTGYPEHKPDWFKSTAGKAAFKVFSAKGQMKHGLAEPIPGAPDLIDDGNIQNAYQRLVLALNNFADYSGPLKPHFAYGELSKEDYALAHVMHVNNHFELLG